MLTSRGPGRLKGPKRVSWVGNRDLNIYKIWHARNDRIWGTSFSMPASANKNISLRLALFKILPGATSKALTIRIFFVGRVLDIP